MSEEITRSVDDEGVVTLKKGEGLACSTVTIGKGGRLVSIIGMDIFKGEIVVLSTTIDMGVNLSSVLAAALHEVVEREKS